MDMSVVCEVAGFLTVMDRVIPAVNVQVDGFPGVVDGDSYPLYFEIPFEDGSLWVVEYWGDGHGVHPMLEEPIITTEFGMWKDHCDEDNPFTYDRDDNGVAIISDAIGDWAYCDYGWDEWMATYQAKVNRYSRGIDLHMGLMHKEMERRNAID